MTTAHEQSYPTDREWVLLLHINTLTTAIEEALTFMPTGVVDIEGHYVARDILDKAHRKVWAPEEATRE